MNEPCLLWRTWRSPEKLFNGRTSLLICPGTGLSPGWVVHRTLSLIEISCQTSLNPRPWRWLWIVCRARLTWPLYFLRSVCMKLLSKQTVLFDWLMACLPENIIFFHSFVHPLCLKHWRRGRERRTSFVHRQVEVNGKKRKKKNAVVSCTSPCRWWALLCWPRGFALRRLLRHCIFRLRASTTFFILPFCFSYAWPVVAQQQQDCG